MDKAITSLEYSLSLNPTYFAAHAELGHIKIDAGRARESIGHIEEAIRLIPPEPNMHVLYFSAGMAALHIADDRAAAQWLLKARQANRSFLLSAQFLAVTYLGIEEEEAARTSLAEFLKETPKFSIVAWKRLHPTRNPVVAKQRERIFNAWLDWVFLRTRPLWEIDSTQPGAPFPILYEIRAKDGFTRRRSRLCPRERTFW